MKKNLLLLFLLLTVGMTTARAQKFALIDMEYILNNIPAYESAMSQLEQDTKKWQAEVEKLGEEAKNMYKEMPYTMLSKPLPHARVMLWWKTVLRLPASSLLRLPSTSVMMCLPAWGMPTDARQFAKRLK